MRHVDDIVHPSHRSTFWREGLYLLQLNRHVKYEGKNVSCVHIQAAM